MMKRGDRVEILRGTWKYVTGEVVQVIGRGERYGVKPKYVEAPVVSLAASSVRKIDE